MRRYGCKGHVGCGFGRPILALLHEDRANAVSDASLAGEDAHHSCSAFDFAVKAEAFQAVVRPLYKGRSKFSPKFLERAARMVIEHRANCPSQWMALTSIAGKVGCMTETQRGEPKGRISGAGGQ